MLRSLLRIFPMSMRQSIYYRLLNQRNFHLKHMANFKSAPLLFSPKVKMLDLVAGDVISGNLAFLGFYERVLSHEMVIQATKGGLLVDVGANMGYYSLIWCGQNVNNRVYAFEASPGVAKKLENNIAANNFNSRIKLYSLAVGASKGEMDFELGSDIQTGWGGLAHQKGASTVTVKVERLDEIIFEAIDVLKIDIEGADTWALLGAEKLLQKKLIKKIFFEQNYDRMKILGIKEGAAQEFLQHMGYVCQGLVAKNDRFVEFVAWPK